MVGRVRLELTTNGLKGRCSTIELPTQHLGLRNEDEHLASKHCEKLAGRRSCRQLSQADNLNVSSGLPKGKTPPAQVN